MTNSSNHPPAASGSRNKTGDRSSDRTQPSLTVDSTGTSNSNINNDNDNRLPEHKNTRDKQHFVHDVTDLNPDPFKTLTNHQITQLATLLRLPASNEHSNITTNHQGWLRDQAEQIARNLDEGLKEPPEDKFLRRLGLGIFCLPVGTPVPIPTPVEAHSAASGGGGRTRLCSSHRDLRRDIIGSLVAQLRGLWGGPSSLMDWKRSRRLGWLDITTAAAVAVANPSCAIEFLGPQNLILEGGGNRPRRDAMAGGLEEQDIARKAVQDFVRVIIDVSALTMPEREVRDRFGGYLEQAATAVPSSRERKGTVGEGESRMFAGPDDTRFKYIASGCEACVLATVGRGGGSGLKGGNRKDGGGDNILAVLRAALLARERSVIRQRRPVAAGEENKPGLLRLVEAWIALDEKEHVVSEKDDEVKRTPQEGEGEGEGEDRDENERRATIAREQRRRLSRQRAREPQSSRHPGQQRGEQVEQEWLCHREEQQADSGPSGQGGELSSHPTSSQQQQQPQKQQNLRHEIHPEQPRHPHTGQDRGANGGQVDQVSESSPQTQPQEEQQQDHESVDDESNSIQTSVPFTGTTRRKEKESLPKVYAHILPLSLAPHNQQLHRREAKENLREEFQGEGAE